MHSNVNIEILLRWKNRRTHIQRY